MGKKKQAISPASAPGRSTTYAESVHIGEKTTTIELDVVAARELSDGVGMMCGARNAKGNILVRINNEDGMISMLRKIAPPRRTRSVRSTKGRP